jgi:hypothetical protein
MKKHIKNFPDYLIHSEGYVISCKNGKERRMIGGNSNGYPQVTLRHKGLQQQFLVHRLVAEHFLPTTEFCKHVNHIDGNKSNNQIANLEWVSPKENMQHAVRSGLWTPPTQEHYQKIHRKAGEKRARFTELEASNIRTIYAHMQKPSCRRIASAYGCSKAVIQRIVSMEQTFFKPQRSLT